jgi:hypothetical protein
MKHKMRLRMAEMIIEETTGKTSGNNKQDSFGKAIG